MIFPTSLGLEHTYGEDRFRLGPVQSVPLCGSKGLDNTTLQTGRPIHDRFDIPGGPGIDL